MTEQHDLDRQLNAFLLDGPTSLPDSSFDAVRDRTEQTRQRVVLGPWRVPTLNKLIPIGLGAAALVAVLFLGSRFIGSPSSNVGGPASEPPASAAPSEAPASAAPASAAPSPVSAPPLTQTFTSQMHGISVSYPEGWTARAATEPWTGTGGFALDPCDPSADVLDDPLTDNLFLLFALAADRQFHARRVGRRDDGDRQLLAATEPIAVDGATGLIGAECLRHQCRRHNRRPRLLYPALYAKHSRRRPLRHPTIGRGSRRSSRPFSSSPRMPSMWRRPLRR